MQTLFLANPTCGLFPRPQLPLLRTNTSLKDSRRALPRQSPLRSIRCAAALSLGGDDGETDGGIALKYPRRHVLNPYKHLGLSPDASEEEIREAQSFLLHQYAGHERSMESIEDAYDKLLMASFRQHENTIMNLKSRLKRIVEESDQEIA